MRKKFIGKSLTKGSRGAGSGIRPAFLGAIAAASAIGAGLMYLIDPSVGRGRRVRLGEKAGRIQHRASYRMSKYGRHVRNQLWGILARLGKPFLKHDADDVVVRDRVRTALGRKARHSRAIEVVVTGGEAVLSGPVLADEVRDVIAAVRKVEGVQRVRNLLRVHGDADQVSALQDEGKAPLRDKRAG